MNLGVGAERMAMILGGYEDIRKMVYPKIYDKKSLKTRIGLYAPYGSISRDEVGEILQKPLLELLEIW